MDLLSTDCEPGGRLCAIGPATAGALADAGHTVDAVPDTYPRRLGRACRGRPGRRAVHRHSLSSSFSRRPQSAGSAGLPAPDSTGPCWPQSADRPPERPAMRASTWLSCPMRPRSRRALPSRGCDTQTPNTVWPVCHRRRFTPDTPARHRTLAASLLLLRPCSTVTVVLSLSSSVATVSVY